MIHFIEETLLLFPFLFVTYLVIEAVEAHAGGALERFLERSRSVGPLAGALFGVIPQCGVSAMAASFFSGGIISAGTLLAVFLSTADELIPVLLSSKISPVLILKIMAFKVVAAILAGFAIDALLAVFKRQRRGLRIGELCEISRCNCHKHKGIVVPALIHSLKILLFVAGVSAAVHLLLHHFGHESVHALKLDAPVAGELLGGLLGLVPNCAASAASAKLYAEGLMSIGALMSSSFTAAGVGVIVLFRTNRNVFENLAILAVLYIAGVTLGWLSNFAFAAIS